MSTEGPAGIRIVFADDDLLVVDKPAGMPSVPARTPLDPPDVAAVLRPTHGILEAVHRLDRDTTGLLVLARSPTARAAVGRSFEAGNVVKRYRAVVRGRLPARCGTIHQPLADDRERPPRKRVDPILGRRATSRWSVLDETAPAAAVPLTLVALEPVTGRSHQLRVHLAWLGCPIVGDRLYTPAADAPATALALCSVSLEFPHPRSGVPVAVATRPPPVPPWTLFPAAVDHVGRSADRSTFCQ